MHRQFEDRFDAIESGIRTATYARLMVDGGGGGKPAPTPTTTVHNREVTVDGGRTKSVPVTPTDQVKEAVKDGAISKQEQTAFDKAPTATAQVVKDEQKRLTDAVRKAQGDDLQRNDDGRLKLEDGKAVANADAISNPTDHEKRVQSLAETRDTESLDQLDATIKRLESAGATVGVDALKQQRAERASAEGQVVDVVKDKLALVGTLEAEKLTLDADTANIAKDDYQVLRTDAQKWIEQFNANGGQYYEGNDWFGDDWDESKVDFDKLADRFHDDPDKLKEFAEVQGEEDKDLRGKSTEEIEAYLADRDPEEASRIALRYQAAQELTGIFERYNSARDGVDNEAGRAAQLDTEISYLNNSIEQDLQSLSSESLDSLERHVTPIDGIIEAPAEPTSSKPSPSKPSPSKPSPSKPTPSKPNPTSPSGAPDDTPKTTAVDYSRPENREKVLREAQQQNYLPTENVTFNDSGQAVYTVQPNNSYWRIADMSDGKAPHEFDSQHFSALVNSNSERLGRDPQVGLIHPDEQVILNGRSVEELVALLGLPTVQDSPDPEPRRYARVHNQPV